MTNALDPNVQPFWPPLEPEELEEVVEEGARELIEFEKEAWDYLLSLTLGYWELPPRKRLAVLLDGIDRMRVQLETNPELAMYGPVRPDVAYFDALRVINGIESTKMLKDFVHLIETYAKDAPKVNGNGVSYE